MEKIIELFGSLEVALISVILIFNALLSAAVTILETIKRPLSEDHVLFKIADFLQKVLDFIGSNKKHD